MTNWFKLFGGVGVSMSIEIDPGPTQTIRNLCISRCAERSPPTEQGSRAQEHEPWSPGRLAAVSCLGVVEG